MRWQANLSKPTLYPQITMSQIKNIYSFYFFLFYFVVLVH